MSGVPGCRAADVHIYTYIRMYRYLQVRSSGRRRGRCMIGVQVAVTKGDQVEVEGEEMDGWLDIVRLADGAEGIVPAWVVDFDV